MIPAITFLIAIVGALLLLILFVRIRETDKEFKLDVDTGRKLTIKGH